MGGARWGALVTVVLALVGLAAPAATAQASGSEILSVTTTATVRPDGSMAVREVLAYDFDGERNGGFRTFEADDGYDIADFRVTEGGEARDLAPGFEDPDDPAGVRWFGSADHRPVTGRHDYVLEYVVLDAVDVHADVAELHWQFVGADFPRLASVAVDVRLPSGDGVQAFAHGALQGVIEAEDDLVRLRVLDNPPGQFVEARILLPVEAFTVAPEGRPRRDAILAEEARFAEDANEQRAIAASVLTFRFGQARREAADAASDCDDAGTPVLVDACAALRPLLRDADRVDPDRLEADDLELLAALTAATDGVVAEVDRIADEDAERRGLLVGTATAGTAAVAFLVVHRVWGREPAAPEDVGDYWRDVPTEPPAIVAAVDRWGRIDGSTVFATTVVDLAQRGLLTIAVTDVGHRFTITDAAQGQELHRYESAVLHRLFPGGRDTVTQRELMAEARVDPAGAKRWLDDLRAAALDHHRQLGYQARAVAPFVLHAVVVLATVAAAVVAAVSGSVIGALVAGAAAIALVAATPLLRRRTEAGNRRHAEIEAFKRFLRDFSNVDDVPLGHLALYERYLVYAIALGVAVELQRGLLLRFPQLAEPGTDFAAWYAFHGADAFSGGFALQQARARFEGGQSLANFGSAFDRAAAVAFTPPARSGGVGSGSGSRHDGGGFSSGGFSSGGGGGGGGGGAGSW